ncbi:MAG TPA: hypothetical protein QF564_02770 [Pirellulaceae bacterium]|jgi:hypothetical protein|nr:hypothetical protein [Pirellulaceae bacterium]
MDASTLTGVSRSLPNIATQHEDPVDFLQPNPKFEYVLRHAQETKSRIWLFYHAAYLEAFARTAPFRRISADVRERICLILDEDVPRPFKNPEERSTFFHHADKARRVLDWRKLD